MSVYQVEEYCVYVSLNAVQYVDHHDEIHDYIYEQGFESYEITKQGVTIDGFDSEIDAEEVAEKIESIIEQVTQ